ncbi:unnamed protein product, partial [Hymenolepis diminuta]
NSERRVSPRKLNQWLVRCQKPIDSSKKDIKRNENLQKNLYGRITKTSRKEGRKRKQHPELILAIFIESKPVPKLNTVGKTKNEDLLS